MKTHNFGHNRAFAFAFAWFEAQHGARVTLTRRGRDWTVTIKGAAA